jgi:hypothetical protein
MINHIFRILIIGYEFLISFLMLVILFLFYFLISLVIRSLHHIAKIENQFSSIELYRP